MNTDFSAKGIEMVMALTGKVEGWGIPVPNC